MCKDQCNSFLSRIRGNGSELDNSNRTYATCALVSFCTCETSFFENRSKVGSGFDVSVIFKAQTVVLSFPPA